MEESSLLSDFFRFVFDKQIGWLCIATESSVRGDFKQRFFQWPLEESQLLTYINKEKTKKNVWFCVNLLGRKERKKEACKPSSILWADLDDCHPDAIDPKPQIVIESSPDRYQALWKLDDNIDAKIAEDYSRRIYGQYKENGVDAGWALTKLLRVPFTENLKYENRPQVKLLRVMEERLEASLFDELSYERRKEEDIEEDEDVPDNVSPTEIIARFQGRLLERGFQHVWGYEPKQGDDRSSKLWNLILICLEVGMTKEEAYSVAYASTVNKYRLDNRPDRYLWRDVQKASLQLTNFTVLADSVPFLMPELIPGDNYKVGTTIVERYIKWGKEATDASPRYHELGIYMVLSSLLAGNLKLDTSFGAVYPNLWGMILGDSTLTRKTTAMRMAVDIIEFCDKDIILATDGSAEGIITGLSVRPGTTSLFFRDEVVGLLDSIRRKDWLAGVPQLFTQLYDGTSVRRVLRKETIHVSDPIFLFFGGGIKDQFYVAVDESFVHSGFLPRFLIVSGVTDRSKLRRLGPPTIESMEEKQKIYAKLHELYHAYMLQVDVEIVGMPALEPAKTIASMTKEAYDLYGDINDTMIEAADHSPNRSRALPTFERLSMSLLKMALLNAACRQEPQDFQIEVTDTDIRRAAKFVQDWGWDTIDVISNVGQTVAMRLVDRANKYIKEHPGTTRAVMMRALNIAKRQMVEIEETLEARGHIKVLPQGKGRIYEPIDD